MQIRAELAFVDVHIKMDLPGEFAKHAVILLHSLLLIRQTGLPRIVISIPVLLEITTVHPVDLAGMPPGEWKFVDHYEVSFEAYLCIFQPYLLLEHIDLKTPFPELL